MGSRSKLATLAVLLLLLAGPQANARTFAQCLWDVVTGGETVRFPPGVTDPIVAKWMALKEPLLLKELTHKPGDFLTINQKAYKIEALIGKGDEGSVYLVQTPNGVAVAKVFRMKHDMDFHVRNGHTNTPEGYSLPRTLEQDWDTGTLLMEYRQGVPVSEIKIYWKQLGLSKAKRDAICDRFDTWSVAVNRSPARIVAKDSNYVYDFINDRFQMVDAR